MINCGTWLCVEKTKTHPETMFLSRINGNNKNKSIKPFILNHITTSYFSIFSLSLTAFLETKTGICGKEILKCSWKLSKKVFLQIKLSFFECFFSTSVEGKFWAFFTAISNFCLLYTACIIVLSLCMICSKWVIKSIAKKILNIEFSLLSWKSFSTNFDAFYFWK